LSDRRQQIIEAAMKCFSRKGYRATSIQEIVDELGMAKGSIYFYFKSKEDLLMAVIASFGERMMAAKSPKPEERALPPRERFRLQLRRHFEAVKQQRALPRMLMREPEPVEGGKSKVRSFLKSMRRQHMEWIRGHIDEIYGPEAAPYAGDGAALFQGMMTEYSWALLVGRASLDPDRLASFLADRLDDLVGGMIRSQARPLLDRGYPNPEDGAAEAESSYEDKVLAAARELRRVAERHKEDADEERLLSFLSALAMFEEQFAKPDPNLILVRGMLAFMKEVQAPSWAQALEQLERCLQSRTE